jgi:hypothetical protein
VKQAMKENGVAGQKLGCDFIDINMINIFKEEKINWVDGMTPMMEARAVKSPDEQEVLPHRRRDRRRHALGVHEVLRPGSPRTRSPRT